MTSVYRLEYLGLIAHLRPTTLTNTSHRQNEHRVYHFHFFRPFSMSLKRFHLLEFWDP